MTTPTVDDVPTPPPRLGEGKQHKAQMELMLAAFRATNTPERGEWYFAEADIAKRLMRAVRSDKMRLACLFNGVYAKLSGLNEDEFVEFYKSAYSNTAAVFYEATAYWKRTKARRSP